MADETKNTAANPEQAEQKPVNTNEDQKPADNKPAEQNSDAGKTISKDLYDKKMSEFNKMVKDLKAQLAAKMTDDEKAAAQQNEITQALADARNEIAQLKTENALSTAGIQPEMAKKLAEAIVGNESESIVTLIKEVLATNSSETEAKVRREILEKGTPGNVKTGDDSEKPDAGIELVKSISKPKNYQSLSETKWGK